MYWLYWCFGILRVDLNWLALWAARRRAVSRTADWLCGWFTSGFRRWNSFPRDSWWPGSKNCPKGADGPAPFLPKEGYRILQAPSADGRTSWNDVLLAVESCGEGGLGFRSRSTIAAYCAQNACNPSTPLDFYRRLARWELGFGECPRELPDGYCESFPERPQRKPA